jgi:hypothetical protein
MLSVSPPFSTSCVAVLTPSSHRLLKPDAVGI